MTKNILTRIGILTAVAAVLPMSAFAATYQYVNTSGQLQTVEAANATQASALAINKDPNSGIMLVSGTATQTTTPTYPAGTYQYVNVTGDVKVVLAPNGGSAIEIAPDIAEHSGVMNIAVSGTAIPASMDVPL